MSENFLIIGDDVYTRDQYAEKIKNKFLAKDEVQLNFSSHTDENIQEFNDALGTLPFLADKRVVLMKLGEKPQEVLMKGIIAYLEKPLDTSVLILTAPSAFKDDSSFSKISKVVKQVSAENPTSETTASRIRAFFKSENIVIDDESVSLIIELKGDDTAAIMTELEKLAAYALGIGKIVKKDVEDLVGKSVTSEIYDLVDAINNSDGAWVYSIIDDLYDQKKQPHEILGYLSWYMRTIQNVKKHLAAGLNAGEIASKLKYKPGYVNRLIAQAKQYPTQKIKKWVGLLLKTDSDIKTGLKPPRIALDMLIASFVGSRNKN